MEKAAIYRELSFNFRVPGPEPIDNGIVDPWFFQKVGGFATSGGGLRFEAARFEAARFEAIEKILPGDDGLIDGQPPLEMVDAGLLGF